MNVDDAVYNAIRSRIGNCDVSGIIERVAIDSFDISWMRSRLEQEFATAAQEMTRPSVIFHPKLFVDGNAWCALLGDDLQSGCVGFGETPEAAMRAFDMAFWKMKVPPTGDTDE